MELPKQPATKVNLNEVEEKLRAMRLKRLSRISMLERGQPVLAIQEESQNKTAPPKRYIARFNAKGKPAPIPPKPPLKPQRSPPLQRPPSTSTGAIPKNFKKTPAPPRPPANPTPTKPPASTDSEEPPANHDSAKPPSNPDSAKPLGDPDATKSPSDPDYEKPPSDPEYEKPPANPYSAKPPAHPVPAKPPARPVSAKPPTREERILKKLHRNWIALNEILASNSVVDSDEMEDLKSSLVESRELLERYRCRLKALEARRSPGGSVGRAMEELRTDIAAFTGLRRDVEYRIIQSKLKDCLMVCEMCYRERVSEVKAYERLFEKKVAKHELILMKVLNEQAEDIHDRHKKSTN